jgi:hypothetical protein
MMVNHIGRFNAGQTVVCTNDRAGAGYQWEPGEQPKKGRKYTITEALVDEDGYGILRLKELQRAPRSVDLYGPNIGYFASRFTRLATRPAKGGSDD